MANNHKILTLLLAIAAYMPCQKTMAQSDDFGIWYSIGAEKKLSKKWSLGAEAELRTRNDARTIDRWSVGLDADYKVVKHLKVFGGAKLLIDNNKESISYDEDGEVEKWRPSYYGNRFRTQLGAVGDVKWKHFNFSLREMWQYTYRPGKTVDRYNFEDCEWGTKTVDGKGKSVLRSRIQIDYNIKHCKIDPYANVEFFNEWALKKVRYTIGADWRITKKHNVGMYYRYQSVNGDDADQDVNCHILGLQYKFKF